MRTILALVLCFAASLAWAAGDCVNCEQSTYSQSAEVYYGAHVSGDVVQLRGISSSTAAASATGATSRLLAGERYIVKELCIRITKDMAAATTYCEARLIYGGEWLTVATAYGDTVAFGTGTGSSTIADGAVCYAMTPVTLTADQSYSVQVNDRTGGTCGKIWANIGISGTLIR